jgi:hypothetical protein
VIDVNLVELGVVEGIERLEPEFEVRPLGNRKRLVQRSRKVHAPRTNDCILARVTEALVRAAIPRRYRNGEDGLIKPVIDLLVIFGNYIVDYTRNYL